jgi:hypothetical protein
MRRHHSFSFLFSKLGFEFVRGGSDDEKSAMLELPRENGREIGIKKMGEGWQHRSHYIG